MKYEICAGLFWRDEFIFDSIHQKSKVLQAADSMGRINTPLTLPDGQTKYLNLGVLGLALQNLDNQEHLFFGTLAKDLYSIPTSFLDTFTNKSLLDISQIQNHGSRLGSCDVLAADDQKNLFMGLVDKQIVVKWNTSKSMTDPDTNVQETVVRNPILNWINSLWIRDGYLWLTHNKQVYIFMSL